MRLVVPELGIEPVLRPHEDLAVRLPHAVPAHPLPPTGVDDARGNRLFEIHETALYEELHRRDSELDARSEDRRLSAGVQQEVFEQLLRGFSEGSIRQGGEVCNQRVALLVAELIEEGWCRP